METSGGSKISKWRKLDNAAKVFPATARRKNTKVFRCYCEFNEDVQPEKLQEALNITLDKYPIFKSVLRKGLFWFYLEYNEYTPIVKEEHKPPCSIIYSEEKLKYLFRVNYYKKRVNLEVFHVLTDGTGATQFLKELVKNYLLLAYKEDQLEDIQMVEEDLTLGDQVTDAFDKYYSKDAKRLQKAYGSVKGALQIRGLRTEYDTLQVIEGVLPAKIALSKAKERGVSLTVYLTAAFIYAIHEEMNAWQEKKPILLMVPVNLRNFFPSKSMMNFFGYINPGFLFKKGEKETFEDVLLVVKEYFAEELTEEKMAIRMNEYMRLEKNPILRFAPLEMKNFGIWAGVTSTTRDITAIFSNMGVIKMPEQYNPYIKQFGVYTSTPKLELCMCSFQDRLVLNFTSYFDSINIQRNFFRLLKNDGISVERSEEKYPEVPEEDKKVMKFQQILNFTSINLVVLTIMLNLLAFPNTLWSLFAIGAIALMWVTVTTGFKKRSNLLKNGIWQLTLISIGCIIFDLFGGWKGWSLDLVYPGLTLSMMIFIISYINIRKIEADEYVTYLLLLSLCGAICLPLLIFEIIKVPVLAVLCVGSSVTILSFLLIFKKRSLIDVLQKKLHF